MLDDDGDRREADDDSSDSASEGDTLYVSESGRIPYGGHVNYDFASFSSVLRDDKGIAADKSTMEQLCRDAVRTCRVSARDMEYSTGETFWIGCESAPRCSLEQIALDIFHFHSKDAVFDAKKSGAEWWCVAIDPDDDVGFHFDKDYAMEESGFNLFPHLATVTYLTGGFGPTTVLDRRGDTDSSKSIGGPVQRCWMSHPETGKHMKFDGQLLHGAPSELAPPRSGVKRPLDEGMAERRITFLVNIWLSHKPSMAEPLDAKSASALSLSPIPLDFGNVISLEQLDAGESAGEARSGWLRWKFSEMQRVHELSLCRSVLTCAASTARRRSSSSVAIIFTKPGKIECLDG